MCLLIRNRLTIFIGGIFDQIVGNCEIEHGSGITTHAVAIDPAGTPKAVVQCGVLTLFVLPHAGSVRMPNHIRWEASA